MMTTIRSTVLPLAMLMTWYAAAPADSPAGIGVLGDSYSDEYQFYPPDRSTARNWVEILATTRGLDFGRFEIRVDFLLNADELPAPVQIRHTFAQAAIAHRTPHARAERWKWTCFHRPCCRCQTRVSSLPTVTVPPSAVTRWINRT